MSALSHNQRVAWNLRRARELRGWTQAQAAEKLEPHLGARWSKTSFSAAERYEGSRIRQFDADLLVALARTFDVEVGFFFEIPVECPTCGGPMTRPIPEMNGSE